jgi:hypothetical protein
MGYAAVLAVAMLVAVIGLGTLLSARIELRGAGLQTDAAIADELARSALELVAVRLKRNINWRTTYAHGAWTADEPCGGGVVSFKLLDEADGDLANGKFDPVRAVGRATVGRATRMYSALLIPGAAAPNLLVNGDIEAGVPPWTCLGECIVAAETLSVHGGVYDLRIRGSLALTIGPYQEVTDRIKNNTTYYTETWIRGEQLAFTKKIMLLVNTTTGTYKYEIPTTVENTYWTKMSGTLTTSWSGDLVSAFWHVEATLLTLLSGDIHIDDAILKEGDCPVGAVPLRVRSGSIRREVTP